MDYRYAARMEGIQSNAIREIFKLLAKPEMISFAGGIPASESFAKADLARIAAEQIQRYGDKVLQYGETEGYAPLREAVIPYLATKGVQAKPEDVLIISGGQQGIDLMCKAFLDPGDIVLVEAPTYLAALHIIRTYQGKAVGVQTDEQGILPEDLERKCRECKPKLIYLVPTFQNPTGRTLTAERRREVMNIAARYDVVLIEDDPYRELRYEGEPVEAMKAYDQGGHVVYLSSFSKVISPGMRVGAAVAAKPILAKMTIGKQATDVHTNILSQAIVAQYLQEHLLWEHLAEVCADYRVRMHRMLDAIDACFPKDISVTRPQGGLFIWAAMPKPMRASDLLKIAVEQNVAFVPGDDFFPDESGYNTFRLNFSNSNLERIDRGIEVLGKILSKAL